VLKTIAKQVLPSALLNSLYGRETRVYALGVPKSGTTSIAGIFREHCRTEHEAHRPRTVGEMHAHYTGEITDDELIKLYRARDRRLLVDVESNCFLAYRPDLLLNAFPDAKFIVTIREPLAWLDSILDNNINFPRTKTAAMTQWHSVFFQASKSADDVGDKPLLDRDLHRLDSYLSYWARTYDACLKSLPEDQRLVIGTNQITDRMVELGDFVGFDLRGAKRESSRKNVTAEKHGILDELDADYVRERMAELCQPVIEKYSLDGLWS